MTLIRVYADEAGETHLRPVPLPPTAAGDDGGVPRFGLYDIPTTTVNLVQLTQRRVDRGLHTPPRRQVVVVLRGTLKVITTSGESHRFEPGDCLLADDLHSKGHITRDVGDDHLITLTIGVPSDWECP